MLLPFNLLRLEKMIKKNNFKAVCFGEVLWDVFPSHKKIGGAPLNVALRMNSLGVATTMISRIGKDEDGDDILTFLKNQNVSSDSIQVGEEYKTGVVNVMINEKGNASYDIMYPSSWDKISLTNDQRNQLLIESEKLSVVSHDFYIDAFWAFQIYLTLFRKQDSHVIKNESERIMKITQWAVRNSVLEELGI